MADRLNDKSMTDNYNSNWSKESLKIFTKKKLVLEKGCQTKTVEGRLTDKILTKANWSKKDG